MSSMTSVAERAPTTTPVTAGWRRANWGAVARTGTPGAAQNVLASSRFLTGSLCTPRCLDLCNTMTVIDC